MYSTNKEIPSSATLVLGILKDRLKRRYAAAAGSQCTGKNPSGHMNGLSEAIREVENLIQEQSKVEAFYAAPRMSVLESQTDIGDGVRLQVWFNRVGGTNIRSEVYKFEDGSVIAYQDCINGKTAPLHMSSAFKALYEGEPAFDTILSCAGVLDLNKVELYTMEG